MIRIIYHADGTQTYARDGKPITPAELRRWERKRQRLTGGMTEILRSRHSPDTDTDKQHNRINRSGLTEREKRYVAITAREQGLNEHCMHDPTVPGCTVYESRRQVDDAIQTMRDVSDRKGDAPEHRLHPQLVAELKSNMLARDPSLVHRDQRELEEEIIDRHALPE